MLLYIATSSLPDCLKMLKYFFLYDASFIPKMTGFADAAFIAKFYVRK